jgi:hypothetical protein
VKSEGVTSGRIPSNGRKDLHKIRVTYTAVEVSNATAGNRKPVSDFQVLCDETLQRVLEYNIAAAELSEALAVLYAQIHSTSMDEYQYFKNLVDERRIATEQIRLRLDNHVSEHGC